MAGKRKAITHREARKGRVQVSPREAGETVLASVLVSFLCYRSAFGLLTLLPFAVLNHRRHIRKEEREKKDRFRKEYREMLTDLASSVSSGYSIEAAFVQAEKELPLVFGKDCLIKEDLHQLNAGVRLNKPIEAAFREFSLKWPYEEVTSFAEIFSFAKRLGGNYTANIRRTAQSIGDKLGIRQEMEVQSAEKRMELKVMSVMPIGILAYIGVSSPEFIAPLYGSIGGAVFMTICLVAYFFCLWLGEWIIAGQEEKI